MTASRYDLVIFGATGFTGQYVVEEVIRISEHNPKLTWAVAGRRASRLKEVLSNAYKEAGKEVEDIPVITADVEDVASIIEMCKQSKVVLNCVGPYRFYGEAVVKACVENGAHHVDISGEPQFLERMQLQYNQAAKDAGVYIVGACGFDSIPCETGIEYLRQKFPGQLSYIETFVDMTVGPDGIHYNYGTWQSAIHGFAHANELRPLRKALFPERLPMPKYKAPHRWPLFFSSDVDGWCLPFPGSDKSVVTRSQYYLLEEHKLKPFHMAAYIKQSSFFSALKTIFTALMFAMFASFSFGRKLLESYPGIFSLGSFSKVGPTRKQIMGSTFTITLVGYGHKDKLSEDSDDYTTPPDTKLIVKVKGPEPGYIATPICLVQSALVLLQEKDKLPPTGGVYPPGGAFYKTALVERLAKSGLDFVSGEPISVSR